MGGEAGIQWTSGLVGFVTGLISSGIIVVLYERSMRPYLGVLLDDSPCARGQLPNQPPHGFYHLKVRNEPPCWPLPGRRPAWSCKVALQILDPDGNLTLAESVIGRWTEHPEPLIRVIDRGNVWDLFDPARAVAARKIDVHNHDDQRFPAALKFEGSSDCYLFSNESYSHPTRQNPAWRLDQGTHHLRVTVYYEGGPCIANFWLQNTGTSLDDLRLIPW